MSAPGSGVPVWRRRLAAVLGALAFAAGLGGMVVLGNSGLPGISGTGEGAVGPPRTPTAVRPPPAAAGETRDADNSATRHPGAVPGPGSGPSVHLPGGAAALVRTRVTPDGTLPVPDGLRAASWWGADPGAAHGATVLAGHVDWGGRTGPFAALWDLGRGARVTVVDDGATRRAYRVVETLTLHKDDLAAHAGRLFGGDRPHRLVLVTCGGDVSGGDGYTENRIVVAEPAGGG